MAWPFNSSTVYKIAWHSLIARIKLKIMDLSHSSSIFQYIVFGLLAGVSSLALANTQPYFRPAGVFDDSDRKTAEEYATAHQTVEKVIKSRFAASGDLHCGGMLGQAQVVVRRDVIVTVAHNIFEVGTCKPLAKLSSCKFEYEVDGETQSVALKEILRSGYECPLNKDEFGKNRSTSVGEDVVVIRLSKPISFEVKPYAVNTNPMIERQSVTAVGKSFDFTRLDERGKKTFPRHYGDCKIKDSWGTSASTLLGTNCDSSSYSSGGGLFKYRSSSEYAYQPPELLGVMQGSDETHKQIHATKGQQNNVRPYESQSWISKYVPISGGIMNFLIELKPESDSLPGIQL